MDSRTYLANSGEFGVIKKFNGFDILLVVLGGATLIKKSMKWKVGEFYACAMAGFPRILFGRERGNLFEALGCITMPIQKISRQMVIIFQWSANIEISAG